MPGLSRAVNAQKFDGPTSGVGSLGGIAGFRGSPAGARARIKASLFHTMYVPSMRWRSRLMGRRHLKGATSGVGQNAKGSERALVFWSPQ
jgi:hypothetical protein